MAGCAVFLGLFHAITWTFVSRSSAIAQHAVADHEASTCLLQTEFAMKRENKIEAAVNRGPWFEFTARLPKLAYLSNGMGKSRDMASVWTYLGEQWWMEFIDGQFHKDGPHALDHTQTNSKNGMDGEFYQHSKELYERFAAQSAWDSLLTADHMAQMNAVHRAISCENLTCSELYFHHPRDEFDKLLDNYYKEVMPLHGLPRQTRLQKGLPSLVNLFWWLAKRHPFLDANSRVRLMVLQVEFVRLGGHPVVLWGLREQVYSHLRDQNQLRDLLLEGWCAWEFVAISGKSPFESGQYQQCYDPVTTACLENPRPKPAPDDESVRSEAPTGVAIPA